VGYGNSRPSNHLAPAFAGAFFVRGYFTLESHCERLSGVVAKHRFAMTAGIHASFSNSQLCHVARSRLETWRIDIDVTWVPASGGISGLGR
jgi:hypothetical protein